MSEHFSPRLDILAAPQRRIWPELNAVPADFVLYGGTAVALHLGHRRSDDFDFFGSLPFSPGVLARTLPFLAEGRIVQQAPSTLSVIVDRGGPVNVSFFGVPNLARLRQPQMVRETGLRIASLLDLAGTKASVVQQRAEAKDYVDIDAILRLTQIDLAAALAAAMAIYGKQFNPQITLKALSYFEDGNLPGLPAHIKNRVARAAREVDLDRLPSLTG